jgi:hypothetical protein
MIRGIFRMILHNSGQTLDSDVLQVVTVRSDKS